MRRYLASYALLVGVLSTSVPASAAIITGVTATASSEINLNLPFLPAGLVRSPIYAVNGAGMEPGGDNSAITADQRSLSNNGDSVNWQSAHTAPIFEQEAEAGFGQWFQADLGAVYSVAGVRVFNYAENGQGGDASGIGVRHVNVSISNDGIVFTPVVSNFEIARAITSNPTDPPGNYADNFVDYGTYYSVSALTGGLFSEASFRYLRLDILSNWNGDDVVFGLSELQFEAVPEPVSASLLGIGVVGLIGFARARRRSASVAA